MPYVYNSSLALPMICSPLAGQKGRNAAAKSPP